VDTARHILCLNSGSSSRKFALYRIGDGSETLIADAAVEHIGQPGGTLWLRVGGKRNESTGDFPDGDAAMRAAFSALDDAHLPAPDAAGHRLVHGGPDHFAPERVSPALIATLRDHTPFAPLHLPGAISGIEAVAARFPRIPQAVCFDTAFHRTMPEVAARMPLPREWWDAGVRRYGFHGLSYEYVMSMLGNSPPPRIVIAHLGNGASMVAVRDGQAFDTTMGFTPAGGFMMGTRSGDLDPGVILYLLNAQGFDATRLDQLVNYHAGLLGVSGTTSDVKTLLARGASDPRAAQAIAMFCYQMRKQVGAFAAALGGLDLLVFTGGIGEKAAPVRAEVCRGLEHLGLLLDDQRNATNTDTISAPASRCLVRVIPTNEDLVIARHTHRLIFST
jgi:acetate kinase